MSLPTDSEIRAAIKRIALTSDGRLLYRRLQIELMRVLPDDSKSGALRAHHGRRSLAAELKGLMDEALSKVGPEPSAGREHDPDAAAIVKPGEPIGRGDNDGPRRRVEPYAT